VGSSGVLRWTLGCVRAPEVVLLPATSASHGQAGNPHRQRRLLRVNKKAGSVNSRLIWLLAAFLAPAAAFADGVIAHIVAGGGWSTTITVVNTTSFAQPTTVWFWDSAGSAMTLNVTGLGAYPGASFNLPAHGIGIMQVAGDPNGAHEGYATVVGRTVAGNAIFRGQVPGQPDYEASVPISPLVAKILLPFDNSNGLAMGVALVNTAESVVSVIIRDAGGRIIRQTHAQIVAHQAYVLRDLYPETDGIAGTIEFGAFEDSNPQAVISAIALRFNPTGPFTTITPAYAGVQ
jgi:hypothetical protein